jgi:hypothetical protein
LPVYLLLITMRNIACVEKTGHAAPQAERKAEPQMKAEPDPVASRDAVCVAIGCCKAHTD